MDAPVTSWEEIEEALEITVPQSDQLVLDESRRLTGPGLLWRYPGAVIDISVKGYELSDVTNTWSLMARRILDDIGWGKEQFMVRHFDGGASLAISAPLDALYSAVFTVETIWHQSANALLNQKPDDYESMVNDLRSVITKEANPALMALMQSAYDHGVDALSDDEEVSLGHGTGSLVYSVLECPSPHDVPWDKLHNIPVALITGTNGKTTSVRLSSAIAKAAGKVSGLTSTDFIRVGDDVVDRGDYSGPGGARMLLRDKRLEIAYLEVARGGILRRGLPLRQAQAALVTNVAADHLGQYGINTVPELAAVKLAVHRALVEGGVLVLNADDEFIAHEALNITANICWFSTDANSPLIQSARQSGKLCAWVADGSLIYFDGVNDQIIISINHIPLTMNGAAIYNVRNALGALCLARAMGINNQDICKGLAEFKSNPKDNPGRCNEFSVKGARVFMDFAHNPHSIEAVTSALGNIKGKRRFLMIGHAGDRSDQDIKDLTRGAFFFKPDRVVTYELPDYLRGRELEEITDIIRDECIALGLAQDTIQYAENTSAGISKILDEIEEGDIALLLVLSDRDKAFELLEAAIRVN